MANPAYCRDFQYVPCDVEDRMSIIKSDEKDEEFDHEQSDIVSILMNMAFFPDHVIKGFTIKLGFSKNFIQLHSDEQKKQ